MPRYASLASAILATLAFPVIAHAAVTIDGNITSAEYGSPLAVQTVGTGFGNNFNELNALFGQLHPDGSLALGLTGNLEPNGNGIILFIDARSGGGVAAVEITGYGHLGSLPGRTVDDWGTDTDGGPGVSPTFGGSILLPNFDPEFALEINNNSGTGQYFINVIDLRLANDPPPSGPDNRDIFLGSNLMGNTPLLLPYAPGGSVTSAFDNSNVGGVNGFGDPPGDPLSSTTGLELLLSGDFLGTDLSEIRLMALITNGSGDFLSNQFLPGLPDGYGNLAGPDGGPMYDASSIPNAAVLIIPIPEPATIGVPSPGALLLQSRRRATSRR